MNKSMLQRMVIGFMMGLCFCLTVEALDQFYLVNTMKDPIVVNTKSSREMKEMKLMAGQNQLLGFSPQQITVRDSRGYCSSFSNIFMNGVYNYLNVVDNGQGTKLIYADQSLNYRSQSAKLSPVVFKPDVADKCFAPGSGVLKKRGHLKKVSDANKAKVASQQAPLVVQNLTPAPLSVELDFGNKTQMIDLQSVGATGSMAQVTEAKDGARVVYNIRVFGADGSCTKLNGIGMNPLFNRLLIEADSAGRYMVSYTRVGPDGSSLWNDSAVGRVYFRVTPNSSLTDEYKASCWNPTTGDVFEISL